MNNLNALLKIIEYKSDTAVEPLLNDLFNSSKFIMYS